MDVGWYAQVYGDCKEMLDILDIASDYLPRYANFFC